ncbi:MAG: dihydroorotate dehydrogenase-like protein [Bradyrhizobium sp.]|uniref:dihydroorotate dehydrogenase-like protein n=1 Tax=Bradyrhizobium sp. TaxID=376 RepID=UPI0029AA678C|nr:dihydroorotate dehydrogenase-like protein [Bradyrhizobium sp.]MDX3966870.1 dihydroorotate dehydrogenase-like protein [Bradyrhizobium sp.]
MNLETTYLGLTLAHPVIASASPLSATLDGIRRLEDAGAAAIVTASLFEEELVAEEQALEAAMIIGAESHPEVTSYLPPLCGCRSPLAGHLETIRRAAESVRVPLIASLSATTREGWIGMAADLQAAGAAAIELNLFHVPTDPAEAAADVERRLIDTVRDVRGAVDIPLAVKLGPYFSALPHLAAMLADAGANGIVLFNRFYEPDIDLEAMAFRPTLELSTPKDSRLALMWIALLAGRTPLSLAAAGGVEEANEVVKYLLAGADAVQTASALLRHGPGHLVQLVKGLAEWLEAHGAASVAEIRGRMSAHRLARPEVLLRAQHTPALLLECPCQDMALGASGR